MNMKDFIQPQREPIEIHMANLLIKASPHAIRTMAYKFNIKQLDNPRAMVKIESIERITQKLKGKNLFEINRVLVKADNKISLAEFALLCPIIAMKE